MAEAHSTLPSSSASGLRHKLGSLGNDMFSAIEAILDPAILAASLWFVGIYIEGGLFPPYVILSVIIFSITFPGTSRLLFPVWKVIADILYNWVWIVSLLLFLGFATGYVTLFSESALITWLWVAPSSQITMHLLLRAVAPYLLMLQGPAERAIIVGMNEQGIALAGRISEARYSKVDLTGFFDDRSQDRLPQTEYGTLLGKLGNLSQYVKQNQIQLIYLSLPMASQPRILHILDELKDTTASIYFVPDMFITDLVQGRPGSVCGMPVISVCESPFTGTNGLIKRSSDVLLSLLILVLSAPVLLLIAIAIKLDSPGPVIFKQRRYGLDGKEILIYKFRSMHVCEDGDTVRQAQQDDNRFTRLGGFLRKTSLDEMPQFINVLQGRMSIVGPRPHAVSHNEFYRNLIKGYMVRHKVKPGITGWAQVNGYRGETKTIDKMRARIDYDLDYLRNWSLRLDLHIIVRTALVVIHDKSAF